MPRSPSHPMVCACIDIGSNTTRLLVARRTGGGLEEIAADRVFTRIGRSTGAIPSEKVAEVAAVVATQAQAARAAGASTIRVVATAAIREAANREELCAAVRTASGLPVAILDGEEEARLAFAGATGTLEHRPAGRIGVVDVGGGSTELVVGTLADGVEWSRSLPVGSALADRLVRCDPPSAEELAALRRHVGSVLDGLRAPPPGEAYAVGGSATSLRRLVGPVLDPDSLERALSALCSGPAEEAARRFDLHLERVRLLPAGLVLLEAASRALGTSLQVAAGGLREGVILDAPAGAQRDLHPGHGRGDTVRGEDR